MGEEYLQSISGLPQSETSLAPNATLTRETAFSSSTLSGTDYLTPLVNGWMPSANGIGSDYLAPVVGGGTYAEGRPGSEQGADYSEAAIMTTTSLNGKHI